MRDIEEIRPYEFPSAANGADRRQDWQPDRAGFAGDDTARDTAASRGAASERVADPHAALPQISASAPAPLRRSLFRL